MIFQHTDTRLDHLGRDFNLMLGRASQNLSPGLFHIEHMYTYVKYTIATKKIAVMRSVGMPALRALTLSPPIARIQFI